MSRGQIAILLLLLLSLAVAYSWFAMPRQRRVPMGVSSSSTTTQLPQNSSAVGTPVAADIDFSATGTSQYKKPKKNLFGPLYLAPVVVKRSPPPPAKIKKVKPKVTLQKVLPVFTPPVGPPPLPPLTVLGYLDKSGGQTVFLSSSKGDVFLVKDGDAFADNLIVTGINEREITIARQHTMQQVALPLGEAKSQRLPKTSLKSNRPVFNLQAQPKLPKTPLSNGPAQGNDLRD